MITTSLLAAAFIVLLGLEWRYQLTSVRITVAVLAFVVWLFSQPLPRRAARRVIGSSPAARVTQFSDGSPVSEYASGVLTMERAALEDVKMGLPVRLLSVGVLLWLACSPASRKAHGP